jgi:hypothetical protein
MLKLLLWQSNPRGERNTWQELEKSGLSETLGVSARSTRNSGVKVAITDCQLHFLSYRSIMDIKSSIPALAMHLDKLMSRRSSKWQESTVTQLDQ